MQTYKIDRQIDFLRYVKIQSNVVPLYAPINLSNLCRPHVVQTVWLIPKNI